MNSKNFLSTIHLLFIGLITTIMVSSCGIFTRVEHTETSRNISKKHDILFIASSEGFVNSYSINTHTLRAEHTGSFFTTSPSSIVLNRTDDVLYVANNLTNNATITAARLNPISGLLTELNSSSVRGKGPVSIDIFADKIVSANEIDGSLSLLQLDRVTGEVWEADWRIDLGEGHLSSPTDVTFTNDGAHLYVVDKEQDMIFHFRVHNTNPPLTIDNRNISLPRGTKPKEIVFDRSGKDVYLLCEEDTKIYHYSYHDGALELAGQYDTQRVFGTKGTAIAIHPTGNFVYATHTGSNSGVTVFSRNNQSGALTRLQTQITGPNPTKITFSPKGYYVAIASDGASQVEINKVNPISGMLNKSGFAIKMRHPIDIIWGSFLQK